MTDFLGRGWSFPPRFDRAGGGVGMVADEQDIEESLALPGGSGQALSIASPL